MACSVHNFEQYVTYTLLNIGRDKRPCCVCVQWLQYQLQKLFVHRDFPDHIAKALGSKMPKMSILMNHEFLEYLVKVVNVISDWFQQEFEGKRK